MPDPPLGSEVTQLTEREREREKCERQKETDKPKKILTSETVVFALFLGVERQTRTDTHRRRERLLMTS